MTPTRRLLLQFGLGCCCLYGVSVKAETTVFFDNTQLATLVTSGVTSDTIRSHGYLITYTRDKLFTGGVGMTEPIGRTVRVPWPQGIEAQAVTTGPNLSKAQFTIQRLDGDVFDITSFRAKLLANTAGAGGSIEIMPLLDGEDGFNDPLYFNASGYYSSTFFYDTTPSYLGSTALLKGFDTYKINLYVDFALIGLTLNSLAVPGDFNGDRDVDEADRSAFALCVSGPSIPVSTNCASKDLDFDNDVDQADFGILQRCYRGANRPADPNCAD